jgi:hypothetical protein
MSPSRTATAPGWIELLAAVLREAPKLPDAACRDEAALFNADDDPAAVERAIEICETCCRDLPRCRAWVDTLPRNAIHGVVAGELREVTP